ncbi:unnamed protein product [Linum tenue]|uniref:Remorin C-terminal domain-containing protein n=1 Tax=Linum tenue TaxID=586396 RepID=A0AAV0KVC3_9ROSI|nr:unnamed protein product [Linum tenue]
MRSVEDKAEISTSNGTISFEFHKGSRTNKSGGGGGGSGGQNRQQHHRIALGKPAPSKWDDAQKWLVGLSRGGGEKGHGGQQPRNSNADDRRLIAPVPQQEEEEYPGENGGGESGEDRIFTTKKVECNESIWRANKPPAAGVQSSAPAPPPIRSICVRDMGTEMTPIASQEPSRAATPIRATTPAARSPISSGSTTPVRGAHNGYQIGTDAAANGGGGGAASRVYYGETNGIGTSPVVVTKVEDSSHRDRDETTTGVMSPLEARAAAWDEAECAKYMARYKREEVKIQAWENHEKRKAEMEMRKMEVKAERMKARAQEKLSNKLATTKRVAEEKRANAEAKLNEKAVRTSERADYIRRTGHLPSSFSFKLPSLCW